MPREKEICLYLSGQVQGVGMRQYVQRQASRIGIKGWVRNLPDGKVKCMAQGAPETLEDFVKNLRAPRVGRVDHLEKEEVESLGEYSGFSIEP